MHVMPAYVALSTAVNGVAEAAVNSVSVVRLLSFYSAMGEDRGLNARARMFWPRALLRANAQG